MSRRMKYFGDFCINENPGLGSFGMMLCCPGKDYHRRVGVECGSPAEFGWRPIRCHESDRLKYRSRRNGGFPWCLDFPDTGESYAPSASCVTRSTSSTDVIPLAALIIPSWRRVLDPFCAAEALMAELDALATISPRISSFISISS